MCCIRAVLLLAVVLLAVPICTNGMSDVWMISPSKSPAVHGKDGECHNIAAGRCSGPPRGDDPQLRGRRRGENVCGGEASLLSK